MAGGANDFFSGLSLTTDSSQAPPFSFSAGLAASPSSPTSGDKAAQTALNAFLPSGELNLASFAPNTTLKGAGSTTSPNKRPRVEELSGSGSAAASSSAAVPTAPKTTTAAKPTFAGNFSAAISQQRKELAQQQQAVKELENYTRSNITSLLGISASTLSQDATRAAQTTQLRAEFTAFKTFTEQQISQLFQLIVQLQAQNKAQQEEIEALKAAPKAKKRNSAATT